MITRLPFQTRARTIDHLGREQIADCPTAIAELWKNAYDAYARSVALHIFDGDIPVAVVVDTGHGMNKEEFTDKWLTVGTESKASGGTVPEEDRDGLPLRVRQGQKGIGRLSCGAMGSLLLLASRRKGQPMVAALIDWRLFENPFLLLSDVVVPVVELPSAADLLPQIPAMLDVLLDNVWPKEAQTDRAIRLENGWEMFSKLEAEQGKTVSTADQLADLIVEATFTEHHLGQWPVWQGAKDQGTALFMANLSDTLLAQLEQRGAAQDEDAECKDLLFQTLSGFRDPFAYGEQSEEFAYNVVVWSGQACHQVLDASREFDRGSLRTLEHYVDGSFDEQGVFRGVVRAFGEDIGSVEVPPPPGYLIRTSRSRVGPFDLCIGTFEGRLADTTHTQEEHALLQEQAKRYSGLGVYRDSLRVLPYGRSDNDFFKIEERRGKSAGREFWANRQLFGRVAITRAGNPKLRDKAGREGLIDNTARNHMRALVVHFLKTMAREHYGSSSAARQERLPLIQQANKERAEEESRKARRLSRSRFRKELSERRTLLNCRIDEMQALETEAQDAVALSEADRLLVAESKLDGFLAGKAELRLPPRPRNLGALEDDYFAYEGDYSAFCAKLESLAGRVNGALERLFPATPGEIAFAALRRHAKALHDALRSWKSESLRLLDAETRRVTTRVGEDNKEYDLKAAPLMRRVQDGRLGLADALAELDLCRDDMYAGFSEFYDPYIRALRALAEGVDIDSAGGWDRDEAERLGQQLEQFSSLAQLGITVEIIGHELERFDHTIGVHLRSLPAAVQETAHFRAASDAHAELVERLRFLSPLKLSGVSQTRTPITGQMISSYVEQFFKGSLEQDEIAFSATPAFQNIVFEEFRSRIYPVFINLVNNSRYWVCQVQRPREILLDFIDGKVIVADSGPGVPKKDQEHLFGLFFTRRMRGRGVGLYLCRVSLAQGQHTILYAVDAALRPLPGASFSIEIQGVTSD